MENKEATIAYSNHPERADLSGRDLLSILGKTRDEVASSTGLKLSKGPFESISVPVEKITSLTGDVADEVHEWPNASQGTSFRSLSLHFRSGALIAIEWNFSLEGFLPKKTPWYKKLI